MTRSIFDNDAGHRRRGIAAALALILAAFLPPASGAQVTVVVEGEPRSVVVTAETPTRTAAYAVEELVEHVRLATGVTLDVVPESKTPTQVDTRIYVGETESALRQGIDVERLPRESFVLRSVGNDLYILGRESGADPLELDNPDVGTLFGVYEFLEEFVGVRWLWPGELGTYAPATRTIALRAVRRLEQPALRFRYMRIPPHDIGEGSAAARLGFSPRVALDYDRALRVLYRRHRLGGRDAHPRGDHKSISWNQYGDKHPEWFVLTRDGRRGNPKPGRPHPFVSLCVTNEELQDHIVEQWDGERGLVVRPVDRPGRCTCEPCRAWDGPQPERPPWFARLMYEDDHDSQVFYGQTSDRYVRFWQVIREKAARRNPHVRIFVMSLYENEFTAPVNDVHLGPSYYGEFVQWRDPHLRYFPMPAAAFEWMKEQWLGWKKTGMRMGYRPNYLLDGYVLPHFETRQSGAFFKFAYENGMEGTDFDMNTGQWAAQGLRLYMHLRLNSDPELEIDAIRQEYFSAFGPAAESVRRYCDYWEGYAVENTLNFIQDLEVRRYAKYPLQAHDAFPPEVFDPAVPILEQALREAGASPRREFAERVRFLQVGLEHALRTVAFTAVHDGLAEVPEERVDEAREALRELVRFRKDHQHLYFSDLAHVTRYMEARHLDLGYFPGL